MSEFNKFSLYTLNYGSAQLREKDEVEMHIEFLRDCDEYEEVKSYLQNHFGEIDGERWVDFKSCHKECYLKVDDTKIEFCSLKNHKQYYGKGWIKIKD